MEISQNKDKPADPGHLIPVPLAIKVPVYYKIKVTVRLEDTEEEHGTDVAEG